MAENQTSVPAWKTYVNPKKPPVPSQIYASEPDPRVAIVAAIRETLRTLDPGGLGSWEILCKVGSVECCYVVESGKCRLDKSIVYSILAIERYKMMVNVEMMVMGEYPPTPPSWSLVPCPTNFPTQHNTTQHNLGPHTSQ